jgi:hypothetical protein
MGKFDALAADVVKPSRMSIIYPGTEAPLKIKEGLPDFGKEAYLDLLAIDSDPGRKIDRERTTATIRKLRSGRNRQDDEDVVEEQVEKLVALTVGWYLVDPEGSPIEVEFSKDNARELYSSPAMGWLRRQAWVYVVNEANFIKGSSTT